jgi:hypothetical protein
LHKKLRCYPFHGVCEKDIFSFAAWLFFRVTARLGKNYGINNGFGLKLVVKR